ncbi:hypothetical protein SEA_LYELL_8 [Microbacterium phage Lyell]|nr:hypothetical protein SEA_LYELL_123 [Microbacterium phage Lyell]AXC36226.1 hypothetical protein SEA_LYELL_8 [Microbacterium phage Lyell]
MRNAPIAAMFTAPNRKPLRKVSPAYVQVNVGRNVGMGPLSPAQWAAFQAEVVDALRAATIGRGVISTHTGRGAWQDDNGNTVSEDSAYFSTFAVVDVPALRGALRTVRNRFEQDAIALIVGSELI